MVARFPSVESLAQADFETFFPYYEGLGYYSRARNLLAAAKIVADRFDGMFPKTTEELRSLPGVGPYTAEAVRAFAYGVATLPFDTNLEKVFSRYHHGTRFQKLTTEEKSWIVRDFRESGFDAATVSGALMDFANLVSLNSKERVDWKNYPLIGCRFHETRGKLEVPQKRRMERFPMKDSVLVAVLTDHSGKVLYCDESVQNGTGGYVPFLIPPAESDPREAIKEHFLKKGLAVSVRPPYSKGFLDGAPLAFFRCRVQTGNVPFGTFPKGGFGAWWMERSQGKDVDFSIRPF